MTASLSQLPIPILNALRKATSLAININPRQIALIPHTKSKAASGGAVSWTPGIPRPTQTFTIEPVGATLQGIAGAAGGIKSADGATGHTWSYQLTGQWDSVMDIYDTWVDGDTQYRIVSLNPFNGYERTAVITAFGKDPNYGI